MMDKTLILVCLVICASTIVRSLVLENLCEESIFQYKDIKVNAIHRLKYATKLDHVGTFKMKIRQFINNLFLFKRYTTIY